MAVPYPCVLVFSPGKGGVGVSTVAAGLMHFALGNVVGIDLTGTCHLPFFLDVMRPIALGSVVRQWNLMPARVNEILRRRKPVLVLDWEGRTYPDRVIELVRLLHARIPLVLDGGDDPPPGLLPLATHLVVVVEPDVRAVDQLAAWLERQTKPSSNGLIIVENRMEGESLLRGDRWGQVVHLPLAKGDGDFGRLMRGPLGEALQPLSARLLPTPAGRQGEGKTGRQDEGEKGILRGLFRRLAS